jgi:hypothetical protein
MQFKSFAIARAALTALILGASAQATILNEYSNVGAWTTATTGQVTQGFNGFGSPFVTNSNGITLGQVKYLGFYNESSPSGYATYLEGSLTPTPSIGSGSYMVGGGLSVAGNPSNPETGISATLNSLAAVNALSFNFSAWREPLSGTANIYSTALNPINLTLKVYEGVEVTTRTLTVPAGSPLSGFFGFTTAGTITSIRLLIDTPTGTAGNSVILDNFAYATAVVSGGGGGGEIPEPQTYLLCAAGLFGVALFRRKKN